MAEVAPEPLTCNLADGAVAPIPTLPVDVILSLSAIVFGLFDGAVLKTKSPSKPPPVDPGPPIVDILP